MTDIAQLKNLSILIAEDEPDLRRETAAFLEIYFGRVIAAADGREALTLFKNHTPDIVMSDIRMPVMDGVEMAARLKETAPDVPLIFCTAYTDTDYLLKAIELGVAAFVRKPVNTDELLAVLVKSALPILQRLEITGLASELAASMTQLLGDSPAMQTVADMAARVARSNFNVLIQGETGTGKSRLAGIIHSLSRRREHPFTTVQLAAIPQQLAESELFGHVRGAFTGAERNKTGLLEASQGGTVFLDDIESCPARLQAKLLHFVEEKRFTPVGSTKEVQSDARIIAASNRNLKFEVTAGRFREDLYYRLADYTIPLPPLRDARDTIIPLASKFLHDTCDELDRPLPLLDDSAKQLLAGHDWPGNIRQLQSSIRRAVLHAGDVISAESLLGVIENLTGPPARRAQDAMPASAPPPFPCSMDTLEKWSLGHALQFCGGKRMKTAAMLGMNYYTFRRRLAKHGISGDED